MRWVSDEALGRLKSGGNMPDLSQTKYRLIEPIGRGGMGVVFSADDTALDRRVAIKVLDAADPTGDLAARLIREARVLAQLEHPGIVPVHDVGELPDGRIFYVMKYVRGQRLDEYRSDAHSVPERLRLFGRICEAVDFAHAQSILHRDLKPQNIMVGPFGEVLVMDWGVAKVLATGPGVEEAETLVQSSVSVPESGDVIATVDGLDPTEHGVIMGTPGYMAPEQARGEVESLDGRADVYSLGAVLLYLLTRQPGLPNATTAEMRKRHKSISPSAHLDLPRRLASIVRKAMAPEPDQRYRSVRDMADDIDRYLDGQTVSAHPETVFSTAARFASKHRIALILILAYVVVRTFVLLFLGR